MSRIVFANPRSSQAFETDFPDLVDLLKGSTVISLADSERFIEFGLSENLLLRIEAGERGGLQVTVMSTLNLDDTPPARLRIVEEGEEPSAALVERRLHSLRQVYAIIYLLNAGREEELAAALRENPSLDIEQQLLKDEERLYLQAAGPGSWWVTVITTLKGATSRATLNTLSLLYGEGRTMLLERVRTGTDALKQDTRAKAIANDKAYALAAIEIAQKLEKIKDPDVRKQVQRALYSNTGDVNQKSAALLPPPDSAT
jgi:hypothetical protein